MVKYKNIRVKKPNGGYRLQRVQVLASGKYKFVKNPRGMAGRTKKYQKIISQAKKGKYARGVKTANARRRTYVARRKKRGGSRRGMNLRIGATVGIVAALFKTWQVYKGSSNWTNDIVVNWTGYNPDSGEFNIKKASALIPLVAGCLVSYGAAKTGINRYTPKGINL